MVGFRTEELYGENYRDAASVMAHEVFGLQNTDTIDTLCNGILSRSNIRDNLLRLGSYLYFRNIGIYNGDAVIDSLCDNVLKYKSIGIEYFNEVLAEIRNVTGRNIKYALWLCDSISDVIAEYGSMGNITEFDQYETSDVILSDIGRAGKLYGYEAYPTYQPYHSR